MRGNTGGKQRTETVARVHGDIIAAHDQQNKQQNHDDGSDKTEFLTENGENIVVMFLGQIQVLLSAFAEAEAHQAAGADGIERLQNLIAVVRRV